MGRVGLTACQGFLVRGTLESPRELLNHSSQTVYEKSEMRMRVGNRPRH